MLHNYYNHINDLIVEKIQLLLKLLQLFFYNVLILTVNLCLFAKKLKVLILIWLKIINV